MTNTQGLNLKLINRTGGTQPRLGLNLETVAEYKEAMLNGATSSFPPVTVFYDGTTYWLADGFHRVEAALQAGVDYFRADVRQGDRRDAVLFSVGANSDHGLRRNNADKRRAVEALLRDEEWRKWSDSEIARRTNVSDKTVAAVRRELYPVSSEIPMIERTVERNGTTYTMNVGKRDIPAQGSTVNGAPLYLPVRHGDFAMVDKAKEIGLVIGVNDPRHPDRVCVKRMNGSGFMVHWISRELLVYPVPSGAFPKGFANTSLWQWQNALKAAYSMSRANKGYFNPNSLPGGVDFRYELISRGMLEAYKPQTAEERIRISGAGCEWLGLPEIDYPEPVEVASASDPEPTEDRLLQILNAFYIRASDGHQRIMPAFLAPYVMGVKVSELRKIEDDTGAIMVDRDGQWALSPIGLQLIGRNSPVPTPPVPKPSALAESFVDPSDLETFEDDVDTSEPGLNEFTEAIGFFFDGEDIMENARPLYRVLLYANNTINADAQMLEDVAGLVDWLNEYAQQMIDDLKQEA